MLQTDSGNAATPSMEYQQPPKAMILSAGLGTRLKPWTDYHPKALALVNGKSLLQRNIEYLQQFGIHEVVINVHHFADQIIEALEKNNGYGSTITISDETSEVLETGGGLMKAAPYLQGAPFFVLMNADILTNLDLHAMIKQHVQAAPLATLATRVRQTSRYLLFTENEHLCGWRNATTGELKLVGEQTPPTHYNEKAFSGVHIISSEIFSLIRQTGKFSMVDVYLNLAATHTIMSFDHTASLFVDAGKPESIVLAEKLFV